MSAVMASDSVTDRAEDAVTGRTEDGVSAVKQQLEDRLETLSETITMCNRVLNDLKDLSDVLVRKSLQDVSLPLQK